MDFEIYVKLINSMDCELSTEGFNSIHAARDYIKDELLDELYPGDRIVIIDALDEQK